MRNIRPLVLPLIGAAAIAASVSCGDVVRQSRSSSVLVINTLQGASGGGHAANTFGGTLFSDVQVLLTSPDPCKATSPCPTVFSDSGQASFTLVMKDATLSPTTNNQITINRYTVVYTRSDGRNTPGVDVPFPIDAALTVTISGSGSATATFEIVRHTAKEEPPLIQLINNPGIVTTTGTVTFYGKDLVGNDVSVAGTITIEFGNFGDQ